MENTQENYTEDIERRVIKIIEKIKNNRNRPCFQNILTLLNRGGINLEMDNLKDIINILIEKKAIYDKGKEGNESFCLLDNGMYILNGDECDDEPNNIDPVEEYINEKFYEVIINKIKEEVKNTVNAELKTNLLLSQNYNSNDLRAININDTNEMNKTENDALIDALRSEITFLRNEMSSKDTIIKLLINDREYVTKNFTSDVTCNTKNKLVKKNISVKKHECDVNNVALNKIEENKNLIDASNFESDFESVMPKKSKKRSITVIGDSLLKDIKVFKMRKDFPNEKIYIKSFPGSTINCMSDYIKPSLKYDPDHIIIHVGTNDLRSEKTAVQIAEDIIQLALEVKNDVNDVTISGIIPRNDDFNVKGIKVNDLLKIKTSELPLGFLENSNIKPGIHLNNSGLHLNGKGTFTFANNLVKFIKM